MSKLTLALSTDEVVDRLGGNFFIELSWWRALEQGVPEFRVGKKDAIHFESSGLELEWFWHSLFFKEQTPLLCAISGIRDKFAMDFQMV